MIVTICGMAQFTAVKLRFETLSVPSVRSLELKFNVTDAIGSDCSATLNIA